MNPEAAPGTLDASETAQEPQLHPGDEPLDRIAEAHTRVLDTIAGFEKLSEKAEPSFKPVADAFLATHQKHEAELASYLRKMGRDPDEDGSFFGTVNSSLIELRSWFEDVTEDVMDRIQEGEKHVLEGYEQARDTGQTIEANAMLSYHMEQINALLRAHAV